MVSSTSDDSLFSVESITLFSYMLYFKLLNKKSNALKSIKKDKDPNNILKKLMLSYLRVKVAYI